MSGGGRGAVIVGWDPICKRPGDFAVVSPVDKKVVIVGEASATRRVFLGEDLRTMWSCQRGEEEGIGWLFYGLSIARSRPEYSGSGQGRGSVLLANFPEEGLEFVVLC